MTDGFLREEVRCGYTVTAEMKRMWAVQLELLGQFMAACEVHGLRWFAAFGTLLGAARHGGFIPWDDDIDVMMPRADYERLRALGQTAFHPPFFLQTPETDPGAPSVFFRLCHSGTTCAAPHEMLHSYNKGCHIDILPLDDAPADEKERRLVQKRALFLRRLIACEARWQGFDADFPLPGARRMRRMAAPRTPAQWREAFTQNAVENHAETSGLLSVFGTHRFFAVPRAVFAATVYLPFEHLRVPAPEGYAEWLRLAYGDVAVPLPEERLPRRCETIVDTARGYRAYEARCRDIFAKTGGRALYLFGAGGVSEAYLQRYGQRRPPTGFFDNAPAKWGTEHCGLPVHAPSEIPALLAAGGVLFIASLYNKEIAAQLDAMGVEEYYFYFAGFSYPD